MPKINEMEVKMPKATVPPKLDAAKIINPAKRAIAV